jgi:hypothetical protein
MKQLYVLRWLNELGEEILGVSQEYVPNKTSYREAMRTIASRIRQSPHLVPDEATGFYLCLKDTEDELQR